MSLPRGRPSGKSTCAAVGPRVPTAWRSARAQRRRRGDGAGRTTHRPAVTCPARGAAGRWADPLALDAGPGGRGAGAAARGGLGLPAGRAGGGPRGQWAWADFAARHRGAAYDFGWYGGAHPVSYSALTPYLMAALGVPAVGVAAAVAAAALPAVPVLRMPALCRPLPVALREPSRCRRTSSPGESPSRWGRRSR
ncbi:hypothetical protein LN042_24250 [Kitasatospora sp. RB6PN24]|uniref:hypothetical protein n=1 Tax=Kitasatospora humi TaxID=2893891 RepID=UPI001E55870A|nr:hypothetical protein [Kitasatospora humi]MCC9310142.1 hypothetical protein [Kitasatospora humi]